MRQLFVLLAVFVTILVLVLAGLALYWSSRNRAPRKPASRLWKVQGDPVPVAQFCNLPQKDVFVEHDARALLYVSEVAGQPVLMYWSDADANTERWVCSTVTPEQLKNFRDGILSLRQALSGTPLYALDYEPRTRQCTRAWLLASADVIPEDGKPDAEEEHLHLRDAD